MGNDRKAVVKVAHVDKQKELVKRLEKTQIEEYPDLQGERRARDIQLAEDQKAKTKNQKARTKAATKAAEKESAEMAAELAASRAAFSQPAPAAGGDFLDGLTDEDEQDMDGL